MCEVFTDVYSRLGEYVNDEAAFSWTMFFRVCGGMALIESSYLKSRFALSKLIHHELHRTLCDSLSDEPAQ